MIYPVWHRRNQKGFESRRQAEQRSCADQGQAGSSAAVRAKYERDRQGELFVDADGRIFMSLYSLPP